MKRAAKLLSLVALAGTLMPAVLFLCGVMAEGPMKVIMLISAGLWFAVAPFWLKGGDR